MTKESEMTALKILLKRASKRTFKVSYKLGDSFWFCEQKACNKSIPVEYIIVGIMTTATGIEYRAIPAWRLAALDGYVEDEDDLMNTLGELFNDAYAYDFLPADMKTEEAALAKATTYNKGDSDE